MHVVLLVITAAPAGSQLPGLPHDSCRAVRVIWPSATQRAGLAFSGTVWSPTNCGFLFFQPCFTVVVAGALYVPQIGIINPSEFSPINSIEAVIWVAVGGRGTLYGAAAGAFLVNYAKTYFTSTIPEAWYYALGTLFVLVTLFLPRGIVGLLSGRVRKQAKKEPLRIKARIGPSRPENERQQTPPRLAVDRQLRRLQGGRQRTHLADENLGELRCIIGPNGAGKTTMMDVITGKTRPDSGSAHFGPKLNLLAMTEPAIAQAGIGRKFQKPTVFEQLTVFENLELALAGNKSFLHTLFFRRTPKQEARIYEVLEIIGLSEQHQALGGTLAHGQKQWLEIGMLLMQEPERSHRRACRRQRRRRKSNAPRNCCSRSRANTPWWSSSTIWILSVRLRGELPCCTTVSCSRKGSWSRCRRIPA